MKGAMRCVNREENDIFKPGSQLGREMELATKHPQGVIRALAPYINAERRELIARVVEMRIRKLTAAVEGVADPHNTAAVIRTAEAFGMQTVHIIENDAEFKSTRRVTRGTHKWIDFSVWKNPDEFAEEVHCQGKRILVADARAADSLYEIDATIPTALVFGNERRGISERMRTLSDGAFSIPMKGFAESLNVSVAAAVSISVLCRQLPSDLHDEEKTVLKARFYLRAVGAGYDIAEATIQGAPPET